MALSLGCEDCLCIAKSCRFSFGLNKGKFRVFNKSIFLCIMLWFLHVFSSDKLTSIYTGNRNNTCLSRYMFCSWWLWFHFWCSGNMFIQDMLQTCYVLWFEAFSFLLRCCLEYQHNFFANHEINTKPVTRTIEINPPLCS